MAACWQSSSAGRNRFRAIYDAARFVRYEGSVGFNATRGFVSVTILYLVSLQVYHPPIALV